MLTSLPFWRQRFADFPRTAGIAGELVAPAAIARVQRVIPTRRRVEYALGFVGLGLLDDASDELEAIAFEERLIPAVVAARIELHLAAKHWDIVVSFAKDFAPAHPDNVQAWVAWAFALRELERIAEAREVLLQAEPRHKRVAVIHYNLACYDCLLGDHERAKRRLQRAWRLDREFKAAALDDPDLMSMWDAIAALD